jgi:hypothetical protein
MEYRGEEVYHWNTEVRRCITLIQRSGVVSQEYRGGEVYPEVRRCINVRQR